MMVELVPVKMDFMGHSVHFHVLKIVLNINVMPYMVYASLVSLDFMAITVTYQVT